MKRMTRMETKKFYSWWLDSHISPMNSKWLEDNLEEMDLCVKQMLKLIDQDGDSFAKKAEMYYQKRPQLTAHVEGFYRMYRALAERYDNVTGELRKNVPSELHRSSSESEFAIPTPELTPEHRSPRRKPGPRAAGFDFFLGSGGSSNQSRRRRGGYSSSSESDSNSENTKDRVASMLHQRIVALENELQEVKGKLQEYESKDSSMLCQHLENGDQVDRASSVPALEKDLVAVYEELHVSVVKSSSLAQKLPEKDSSSDTAQFNPHFETEEFSDALENDISLCDHEIGNLNVALGTENQLYSLSETNLQGSKFSEAGFAILEGSVEDLKTEIGNILHEKFLLESKLKGQELLIHELQCHAASSAEQFSLYKSALEAQVSDLSQSHASLEAKVVSLETVNEQLESERMKLCEQNDEHMEKLNQDMDELNLEIQMLKLEKEKLASKVSTLTRNIEFKDGQICQMNEDINQLHLKHAKLITDIEGTRTTCKELCSQVKELEEEVRSQRMVAFDSAEEKREAIRQLCFSLEHYRDGYYQLRKVLQGNKRTVVIAR